jgi:hypothetical protein
MLYLSLAAVLGRATPLRRLGEPVASRVAMLGLVVLGTVLTPILGLIFDRRADSTDWNVFNPIIGMVNFGDRLHRQDGRELMLALWAFAGMAVIAACVVLKSRDGERHA